MIDLRSAMAYWSTDRGRGYEPFEADVDRMRGYGMVVEVFEADYAILHPYPLIFRPSGTAKEIRMIDLRSAMAYWSTDRGRGYEPFEADVDRMRGYGMVVEVFEADYAILHPYPLIFRPSGDAELAL